MNSVTLKGRLGGDPELRYTGTGKAVANLNLAVSSGYGENKKTDWFTVVLWGGLAERAKETLEKGSEVVINGKLANKEWTNREGNKVKTIEVVGWSLGYAEEREKSGKRTEREVPVADEDIPF